MVNIAQLKSQLAQPANAALSDSDAAAALSTPYFVDVTPAELAQLVDTRTIRASIVAAQSNANAQIAGAAITAVGVLSAPYPFVRLSDPAILNKFNGALSALLAAGTGLVQADVDAIVGLSKRYVCGDLVAAADVTAARAAMARDAAIDATRQKIHGVYSSFVNEIVNVADADNTKPVPTYADFQAAVTAGA